GSLTDPSSKQVWVWDPIADTYSVLTLSQLGDALYVATSATSQAIGNGSRTFDIQKGKDFRAGDFLLVTSDANPIVDYMIGQVTAYTDKSLTLNVVAFFGSGTHADWTIRVSGLGASGAGYAATSTTSLLVGTGSKAFTTQLGLAYSVG